LQSIGRGYRFHAKINGSDTIVIENPLDLPNLRANFENSQREFAESAVGL
jgi:hypothetical protein